MVHYISPAPLTFDALRALSREGQTAALSEESRQLVTRCKEYLDRVIANA